MQTVTEAWKSEQQKRIITAESLVEVSLNVGDPAAQADAASSDNGHEVYSNSEHVADETEKDPARYAALEKNLWVLDGTFRVLPNNPPYGNNGFIGNVLSGEDGTFSILPTITIMFSKVFTAVIPGVTITWASAYDEWANAFRVTAYNGSEIVVQETISGNTSVTSVVSLDIQGYDKIEIEVLQWCKPYRRARIQSILIGVEKTYTRTELMAFSHAMYVDPLSADLPKAEIKFEIKNLNGEYNPDNPTGVEKYLMERQAVKAKYGYRLDGKTEWIQCGTFYMSEWDTPQNGITASFTARDLLEYMSDKYTGASIGTLMEVAEAALTQAELPQKEDGTDRWLLWSGLSDLTVPAEVDLSGYTIAEVLQLIANAACCVFYQDRFGVLHIEPLAGGATDYRIDQDNSFSNSEISLTKQLKAVNVNDSAAVVVNGAVGETQTVDNPLIGSDRAAVIGEWTKEYLKNRRILSGEWRADPRLDVLDRVTVKNQFAESAVLVTEIEYSYNGAFRGTYEGRAGV